MKEKSIVSDKGIAIVTGASSGIGLSIAEMLSEEGYSVYGIGRHFKPGEYSFHTVECDLLDLNSLVPLLKVISSKGDVSILVNNAGVAYYGLHGNISPDRIAEMTRTNLELPMVLTNSLLPSIIRTRGWIINISSITAIGNENTHGAAYGALKAGLRSFSHSLFAEYRKQGVKVLNIQPDMTDTELYRNADFKASDEEYCSLQPKDVSDVIKNALNMREGAVVTDVSIRPQYHRIQKK